MTTTMEQELQKIEPAIHKFGSRKIPGMDRDDVFQELRTEAWVAWQSYDPNAGTKFSTYVYPILQQKTIDLYRGATAGKRSLQCIESLDSLVENGCCEAFHSMDEAMDFIELNEVVDKIYQGLNTEDKSIFDLLKAGYNKSEISEKCNISISTVSRRKHQIKEKILLALSDAGYRT